MHDVLQFVEGKGAAMHYEVLGPVEASVDGTRVAVGGPQQRRLLALMVSTPGQRVTSERLVDCLWPDGLAPSGAARSVMTYVSRLRAALGEDVISTVAEGYRLELNGSTIDASQFEAMITEAGIAEPGRAVDLYDRALSLWRGTAYGEFGGEWWLLAEAERLNELRVVAMEERAEALLALGHHHRATAELERLVAEHALRERPVALLMRALVASGRHVDALRDFHAFRARLGDETGLEPSAELVELERSIAAGQPVAEVSYRARLLRGYVVHDVLGEGAFGRVFAATQPGTNREVAIKAIRPALADSPEFVHRFEAEAQLVARLEHPHIVPLYDYWREPGAAYLVFRLLTGGTAHGALITDGPFDFARTSRLVEEVGSALMAAHAAGVVHCDVKPSNVLFDESGNSYLSDFGISIASTIDMLGDRTRAYAAPELIDRRGDTVQSDIYSFGCMLWELLAGGSPLTALTMERSRLPSLATRITEPCEGIDAVIAKATSTDPATRFESMAELIIAWREAVGRPEGVLTPLGGTAPPTTSSARRRAAHALTTDVSASVNPYKGLRAFNEADAPDYFGRDDISAALRDALVAHGFVTVVGPSGSGKSSLVHAGLAPLLRRDGSRIVTMVPGDRPTAALRQALSHVATTDVASADEVELIEALVRGGAGRLVLIVDQFEECWTLADAEGRERFLGALGVAMQHGVGCVVTVRADLYDRPLRHSLIGELVSQGTFPVPPLGPLALEQAVVGPAARNGVEFDEGVATAIVAEANAQTAGLPMLQFALAELYERRVDNRVTAQTLLELGGIGGAVGRRAESTYDDLTEEMRPYVRELFGRLVAPGEGSPDTRRRARVSELSEPARQVADRFVTARLLVADRDLATREPVIEVAHESLLANWQRLRGWLEADRRWLAQLHHLSSASRAWTDTGRTDGELYRGARLETVLEALPEHGGELSDDERSFVEASRRARDAVRERELRTNRRLRRLLAAVALVLVVALVAGVIALTQRQGADRSRRGAEITTLATRSLALRSSQRDVAALLAVEAERLRPDAESTSALFGSFSGDPGFMGYYRFDGTVVGGDQVVGAVIPASNSAVIAIASGIVGSDDPPLRRVDLATGQLGPPFEPMGPHDHGGFGVAVSANGAVAAEWTYQFIDGAFQPPQLAMFDVASGRVIGKPIPLSDNTEGNFNLAVNADGSRVAVAGGSPGLVRIFAVADDRLLATIPPPPDMVASVDGHDTSSAAWAPDGRLYVGSSGTHLRVFDPSTFELERDIDVPGYATGGLLKFSDDGSFVVSRGVIHHDDGSQSGSAARIDLPAGEVAWTIPPDEFAVHICDSIAFSAPENRVWCGDYFGVIRGRSLTTGALDGTTMEHQRGLLSSLDFVETTSGRYLVAMGGNSASIGRWRVDGSGPISHKIAPRHGLAPGYSPDSRWVLMASDGKDGFESWNAETDQQVSELSTPGVQDAQWLGDGRAAIVAAGGRLHVVDPQTGDASDVVIELDPDYTLIAPVGANRLAFGYGDGHVDVFDADTGARTVHLQVINPFKTFVPAVDQIAASADGNRIFVTAKGVYEFDAKDGHEVGSNKDTEIRTIAVRGNDAIAVGYLDGRIGLLDPTDLTLRRTLPGARGLVATLRYSADGRLLLARAKDNTMSMYDVAAGQRFGDPVNIGDAPADLRPDGRQIAVENQDGSGITLWSLDPVTMTSAACRIAGRNLTHAEWDTYLGHLGPYRKTCPDFASG